MVADVSTRRERRADLLRMGAEHSADELRMRHDRPVMHGGLRGMLQARWRPRLLSFSQARQHATMGFEDVLRWCRIRSLDAADL